MPHSGDTAICAAEGSDADRAPPPQLHHRLDKRFAISPAFHHPLDKAPAFRGSSTYRRLMPSTTSVPFDSSLGIESSQRSRARQTSGVKRKAQPSAVDDAAPGPSSRTTRRSLPVANTHHGDEPARGEEENLLGYDGTVSVVCAMPLRGNNHLLPLSCAWAPAMQTVLAGKLCSR